ncbi:MAG: DUF6549 family protein [Alistipes sp.]
MNKYLLLYALCITGLLWGGYRHYRAKTQRLEQNQVALASSVTFYRTQCGKEAASVQALRLRTSEFEALRAADAQQIKALGYKLRRLTATAKTATATVIEVEVPVRDTIIVHDTLRFFRWRDQWVSVEGLVGRDSASCRVESIDTLRQIVHRIPRRFLFIRWGTKAIRQEIISTNPHTKIVYSDYIQLERR